MIKILDKNLVGKLYESGFNYKDIALKLDAKQETVRKCIQRNFKELQLKHKRNRYSNKEKTKALNHMCNKYMSDEALINWCRQSFITVNNRNNKKCLIYDDTRGLRPNDLPHKFSKHP